VIATFNGSGGRHEGGPQLFEQEMMIFAVNLVVILPLIGTILVFRIKLFYCIPINAMLVQQVLVAPIRCLKLSADISRCDDAL